MGNEINKVLEEKSPRGPKESERASATQVHGLFNNTLHKKRDSFPPYEAGSEQNSARKSQEKTSKAEIENLNPVKSDNGFNPTINNMDNSHNGEDDKQFLEDK